MLLLCQYEINIDKFNNEHLISQIMNKMEVKR